jgi:hypothetical protein
MIVRTADEDHGLSTPSQVPDIEISRDIGSEMAKMAGAVGIGKTAGYEDGAVTHHYIS